MRKSQSAMEYLFTYGWVFIIIIIIGVLLFKMGLFQPNYDISTLTELSFEKQEIGVLDHYLDTNGTWLLELRNNGAVTRVIKEISFNGLSFSFNAFIPAGGTATLKGNDLLLTGDSGEEYDYNLTINYIGTSGLSHNAKGVFKGYYEDVANEAPGGLNCWGTNSSCNPSCQFSNLGTINYYTNPGCAASCSPAGNFYNPSGACSSDGTGNCYLMLNPTVKNTTCTQGISCGSTCTGTPNDCSTFNGGNCTACGCTTTGGGVDVWTEDFASNTDWSAWSSNGNGIAYVTDSTHCINDANDKCLNGDGGSTNEYLYKQSSEDLSSCIAGTAWFYISHVAESGSLESNDCMYIAFSNNGGAAWSSDTQIFCNDLSSIIDFNTTIPDSYLTNDFRIRIRKERFTSFGEEAWLDGLKIHCVQEANCTGTPSNCATHITEPACINCGCTWTSTNWYWTLGGSTPGFDNYLTCTWYP